ncbi:hypothetical protein ZIOFF_047909 [Zingiber officinale]|uniref:Uncharacterized protein n=1 Tax=Zingiber officinale TaxID=94328 RepID=A0A8J5FQB7_ZINOF|nr:hypothetical protein ZIOFF_047909 [Zingiber officinale]
MYNTSVLKGYHDLELSMATELMVLKDGDKGHHFDSSVILLDPYAKLVSIRKRFGDITDKMSMFLGTYDFTSSPFDWVDGSSGLDPKICGSHLGVTDEILHLLGLGINAVELLPVFGLMKLCGEPLQIKCPSDNQTVDNGVIDEENKHEDDEYGRICYD